MCYYNGKEILPEDLIAAIQEYFDGGYLYIPRKDGSKKSWGESTGARQKFLERNMEIYQKYLSGVSVNDLAEAYSLSDKTIYLIISEMKKLH